MKKSTVILAITGLIVFSFLLVAPMHLHPAVSASGTLTTQQQESQQTPLYYVRIYGNVLAVYKGTSDTPWRVTDIHVSSLRDYDQQLMEQGFPLYSDQDLTVFFEDYAS